MYVKSPNYEYYSFKMTKIDIFTHIWSHWPSGKSSELAYFDIKGLNKQKWLFSIWSVGPNMGKWISFSHNYAPIGTISQRPYYKNREY